MGSLSRLSSSLLPIIGRELYSGSYKYIFIALSTGSMHKHVHYTPKWT
jgi:hypothetical protein